MGGRPPNVQFFAGLIDEIRVQTAERSEEWLLTEYVNQNDPSGFLLNISAEISNSVFSEEVCEDELVTYSIPDVFSSYAWTVTGGTIATDNGNEIIVNWPAPGVGQISVSVTNASGCTGASINYDVTINSKPAPEINGSNDVCPGAEDISYLVSSVVNHSYQWEVNGGTIDGSATGNSVVIDWGAGPAGWVRVTQTNDITGCDSLTANYVVQIRDILPPTITCLVSGTQSVSTDPGDCSYLHSGTGWNATATDNCGIASITYQLTGVTSGTGTDLDGVTFNPGTTTVTWTATDNYSNTDQCSFDVEVTDNEDPTFTVPGPLAIECDDNKDNLVLTGDVTDEADNCATGIEATYLDNLTGLTGCNSTGDIIRTWTLDDGNGNVVQKTQTITVQDTQAPVVVESAGDLDVTLECSDAAGIAAALAAEPGFTDNCTAAGSITVTLVSDVTTPDAVCGNAYVQVRQWTASDGCGNTSATYTQTITVQDTQAPVVVESAGDLDVTLECSDAAGIAAALAAEPSFTDNCTAAGSITVTLVSDVTTPDAVCGNAYVQVRQWTASDGCGNTSATYTQTITVQDTQAPVVVESAGDLDVTLECSDAAGIAAALAAEPSFTDNCTAAGSITVTLVSDVTTPDAVCGNAYVQVRQWTASDGCGNTSAAYTQTITVQDTQAPVVVESAGDLDVTLECSDAAGIAAALAAEPGFTDNCTAAGSITVTLVSDVTTPDAVCGNAYVQVRQWTASDGCGNTSAAYTQTITVQDTQAPVVVESAGDLDVTLECSDAAGIAAALAAEPGFTDNCTAAGSITVTLVSDVTTPDAVCGNAYVQVRQWTASDGCGNTSAAYTQTITVQDTQAPVVVESAGDLDVTLECSDAAGIAAALAAEPSFTDNCTAAGSITVTLVSDVTTPDAVCGNAYVQVRQWTASDGCGNTSAAYTQTITVQDTQAPVVVESAGDLDVTLECSDAAGIAAALAAEPGFTDNCTAAGSITVTLVSDVTTPDAVCGNAYVQVRQWTASDGCGNTSAAYTQTITVQDTQAPVVVESAGDLDVTLECSDAAGIAAALAAEPGFTDNCTAAGSITLPL